MEIERLSSLLLNTGLQRKDNPLYQFLNSLIASLQQSDGSLRAQISGIVNNINNITNNVTESGSKQQLFSNDSSGETDIIPLSPVTINNLIQGNQQLFPDDSNVGDNLLTTSSIITNNFNSVAPYLMSDDANGVDNSLIAGISTTNNINNVIAVPHILFDAEGINTEILAGSAPFLGAGTPDRLAKWISNNTLGDSLILEQPVISVVFINGSISVTGNGSFTGSVAATTTLSSGGVATLNSIVINTLIGSFGNALSYDGANQLFFGLPGTTTAKKLVFLDSTGASIASLDAVGNFTINGILNVGDEAIFTPAKAVTAAFDAVTKTNNLAIGSGTFIRITPSGGDTGGATLSGLTGGTNGRVIIVVIAANNSLTMSVEDAASTAANRIAGFTNRVITAGECAVLIYDGTSSRWRFARVV